MKRGLPAKGRRVQRGRSRADTSAKKVLITPLHPTCWIQWSSKKPEQSGFFVPQMTGSLLKAGFAQGRLTSLRQMGRLGISPYIN